MVKNNLQVPKFTSSLLEYQGLQQKQNGSGFGREKKKIAYQIFN